MRWQRQRELRDLSCAAHESELLLEGSQKPIRRGHGVAHVTDSGFEISMRLVELSMSMFVWSHRREMTVMRGVLATYSSPFVTNSSRRPTPCLSTVRRKSA